MSDTPQYLGATVMNDTSQYALNNPVSNFSPIDAMTGWRDIQVTPTEIITEAVYNTDDPEGLHLWDFFQSSWLPDPTRSLRNNVLLVVPPFMRATSAWLQVCYHMALNYDGLSPTQNGYFTRIVFFKEGGAWVFHDSAAAPGYEASPYDPKTGEPLIS